MINIEKKEDCCACTACVNICPGKCISMHSDEEGFQYPEADKQKCTACGLCDSVCPVLNSREEKKEQSAYIFQHGNDNVRRESTSGGAFTAIAEYVLEQGGRVYGVSIENHYFVMHTASEKVAELGKYRGSKYVQSNLGSVFSEICTLLKNGRIILFSGTPCQIEGLKRFLKLNKCDLSKLLLVDVVCRGVGSPAVWQRYIEYRTGSKDNLLIRFRDKYLGYKYQTFSIYEDRKRIYHGGPEKDPYLRAFFDNALERPSCFKCRFKKRYRESDITLWECFNTGKFNKKMDDDKGTTLLLCHSPKGKEIIKEMSRKGTAYRVDADTAVLESYNMTHSSKEGKKRAYFFRDFTGGMPIEELFNKYYPCSLKTRTVSGARVVLAHTPLYTPVRRIKTKIKKNMGDIREKFFTEDSRNE